MACESGDPAEGRQALALSGCEPQLLPAMRRIASLLLLGSLACARTDLGATCHLIDDAGAEVLPQVGREYLYLGSSECASFACLASPGATTGYCSQPCSGPGASCPNGLVCGQLAIDQSYLNTLQQRLPAARFQALFSQLGGTSYCMKAN
jgi:hypothetical protein